MKQIVRERTFTWSDPRELAQSIVVESGLHWLQKMKRGELPAPPVVDAMGMTMEEVEPGRVVFSMHAEEWMSNPAVVLHGGMTATILDTVLTLAVFTKLPHGKTCTTVQLSVNYVRPILPTGEKLIAEGSDAHIGSTIGTAEGRLYNAAGKLVAHATSTLAIIDIASAITKYPASP